VDRQHSGEQISGVVRRPLLINANMIILPGQAQDAHRENSPKDRFLP
jgi:hypothetical protein